MDRSMIDDIPEEIGEENKMEGEGFCPQTNSKCCRGHDVTPTKQLAHDRSIDSLNQEFEEEVVEIDCGVVDPNASEDI